MIRIVSFFIVVAVLSFSAGYAQSDIFLRKDRESKEQIQKQDSKPASRSIFLKRDYERPGARGPTVSYGKRSNVTALKRNTLQNLKTMEAWEAYGQKPQTAEQILSFASAYRAPNTALMLQERERVSSIIEQRKAARLERFNRASLAASPNPQSVLAANASIAAGQGYPGMQSLEQRMARQNAQKAQVVRRIYRKPTSTVDKPRRVFRDYR